MYSGNTRNNAAKRDNAGAFTPSNAGKQVPVALATLHDAGTNDQGNDAVTRKRGPKITIEEVRLCVKPRIGIIGGISFVTGAVIGSGIFISPKGALLNAGSVGLCLVIWAVSGLISINMGLVYGELGTIIPHSGGDYTIILAALGEIPAFLVTWTSTVVGQPGSRAVLALVFADYLCAPIFGACRAPDSIRKSIAVCEILTLAVTNVLSVRFAAAMQVLFTCLKVSALIIIIVGGIVSLGNGNVDNLQNSFEGSVWDVTSISLAIYSCMWAYGGYNNLNDIAEEIINPRKNIPRCIIISMVAVTIIYLATNVSYFTLLSKEEFLSASAVAFRWGDKVLGSAAIIIPISVMCSVHGASNGAMFTDSRVRFAASRAGHLPELLSFLHLRTGIPVASIVLNSLITIIYIIPGDIGELINLVGFMGFIVQALTVVSLMRFKHQRRHLKPDKNTFSNPWFVPIIALLVCIFMVVSPFVATPRVEFLYGVAFVAGGLLFYVPFVHFKLVVPGTNYVTTCSQLFMNMCPTVMYDDIKGSK